MATPDMLRDVFNRFRPPEPPFEPGQLVQWKEGLKNRRSPKMGEPAVVCQILDEPIISDKEKDSGSAYFREPLDVLLGFFDEEDRIFVVYHLDSRRFESYRE